MKILLKLPAFVLVIACYIATYQTTSAQTQKYDVAAFYCPSYHPDARFKEMGIFPDGKGEWEVIYHGKPTTAGHKLPKVPQWGYEDESDPKVMERKISTAVSHGVNVMIFDWYWYDNRPFLESTLNNGFLKAKNTNDMKFFLMWANHNMTSYINPARATANKELYWPGGIDEKNFDVMTDHIINDLFKKPNYYKINGAPVISIYELSTFINGIGDAPKAKAALDHFRDKVKAAGFPDLHLQAIMWGELPATLTGVPGDKTQTKNSTVEYFGFKSMTNYQWVHFISPIGDYKPWGDKAIALWNDWDKNFTAPFFPHVSMGWDNNPRFHERPQNYIANNTPEQFKAFLLTAKTYADSHPDQHPLITINAWNEWAESSYLEPDKEYGLKYLEAIRDVFKK